MPTLSWVISLLALVLAPILLIRFRKRWVAAFNLAVTNRITSRFAARLPGFGILTHVGRKSGKVSRTPVNVFRAPEGFLIALTYGRECEWVSKRIRRSTSTLQPAMAVIGVVCCRMTTSISTQQYRKQGRVPRGPWWTRISTTAGAWRLKSHPLA